MLPCYCILRGGQRGGAGLPDKPGLVSILFFLSFQCCVGVTWVSGSWFIYIYVYLYEMLYKVSLGVGNAGNLMGFAMCPALFPHLSFSAAFS